MIENDDLELLKKVIAKAERGEAPLPSALKTALTEYVSPQKEKVRRTRKKKLVVQEKKTTRKNSRPQRPKTQKKQRPTTTNKTRKIKIKS
jgi:hypothetical protein